MNKARRTRIKQLLAELDGIQAELEELMDAESDARDNIPESMEARIAEADAAVECLTDAIDNIEEGMDKLREVLE